MSDFFGDNADYENLVSPTMERIWRTYNGTYIEHDLIIHDIVWAREYHLQVEFTSPDATITYSTEIFSDVDTLEASLKQLISEYKSRKDKE